MTETRLFRDITIKQEIGENAFNTAQWKGNK